MDTVKVVNDMDVAESSASALESSTNSANAVDLLPLEALHSIFKLLPFRDLLSCREVNSAWKSAARDPLRKQCTSIPFSAALPKPKRYEMLDSFTKCLISSAQEGVDFPVTKFQLDLNSKDKFLNDNNYLESVQEFVRSISTFVTELTLEFQLGSLKKSKDCLVINKWNRDFPNLKSLTLVVVADDGKLVIKDSTDPQRTALKFARSILDNAPKLQNVAIEFGRDINLHQSLLRLISGLDIIEDGLKLKLISSLSIKSALTGADWDMLKDLGLKLKTLKVCFGFRAGDSDALRLFLEGQNETLTKLEISYHGNEQRDDVVQFPSLPHLKELKIKEKYLGPQIGQQRHELKVQNVSYSTQLPALQKLCLLNAPDAWSAFILLADTEKQPLDTLETLSLPQGWGHSSTVMLTAQLFPNVKKLKLNVCTVVPDTMKNVYEFMPKIEELELCLLEPGKHSIDDLVTGLCPGYCEQIFEAPSTTWKHSLERLERNEVKSMASLENLRVLRIHRDSKEWIGRPEFNEISGVVLKQMKKLECIDFGIRKFPPVISKALRSDLERHLRIMDRPPLHRGSSIAELRTAIIENSPCCRQIIALPGGASIRMPVFNFRNPHPSNFVFRMLNDVLPLPVENRQRHHHQPQPLNLVKAAADEEDFVVVDLSSDSD